MRTLQKALDASAEKRAALPPRSPLPRRVDLAFPTITIHMFRKMFKCMPRASTLAIWALAALTTGLAWALLSSV